MRALIHIEANLDQDLSAPALARASGLSASRFHRVFAAEIGETPHVYVARLRLDRAAFYLATQQGPIADIAVAVGYETPETFTRAFVRRFATTPSAYRAAAPVMARTPARRRGLEQEVRQPALSAVPPVELRPLRHAARGASIGVRRRASFRGIPRRRPSPRRVLSDEHRTTGRPPQHDPD